MAKKETKDFTVKEVVEGLGLVPTEGSEDRAAWFDVRRRFPAIESVSAIDMVLVLVGDKPAFVLEKKLRDAFYSEEEVEAKPKAKEKDEKPAKGKEAKPEKAAEKPAKPEKKKDEEPEKKAKKGDVDDIDALIAEIDGETEEGKDPDPDEDDD